MSYSVSDVFSARKMLKLIDNLVRRATSQEIECRVSENLPSAADFSTFSQFPRRTTVRTDFCPRKRTTSSSLTLRSNIVKEKIVYHPRRRLVR